MTFKRPHPILAAAMVATMALAVAPKAEAQVDATPAQVIALAMRSEGKTPFKATRTQQVIRQDMVLHADAKVNFASPTKYQIALTNPKEIDGLNLVLDQNKLTAFFPKEKLLFQSDIPAGSEEVKDLVMGKLTDDPASLSRNYKVTLAPQMDIVALYPCYKLILEPAKGLGPTAPPGRRLWVAKETGVIMKEERYWSNEMASYFISEYNNFSTAAPTISLTIPREANKLKLAKGSPTNMVRYPSLEAAKADGKTIYAPTFVPDGFKLRAVDVMSLYGTDIVLVRYNDGLNNLTVTYRTKNNAFLTLMAGAFALSLVDKISALSYHAPNNYAFAEKGDTYVYAYGDLWVDALKQVANSVPIPVAKTKQGAIAPQLAAR
jgi:outer membrane lipoprotein-sorting protein